MTCIPHENRGHRHFLVRIDILIYLPFDLHGVYLPLKYYICGQHRACLQKLLCFPFDPFFSFLNWFWTKTVWCHNDCSIILPNYHSLFLTLIGRIWNLKILSVLLQNIFLAWNENFFHAIRSQSRHNRDVSERTLINQLKLVQNVGNWKKHWF